MSATPTVAVYVRISLDQTLEGKGVERQEEDCLKRVEAEGWTLYDVFKDNDTGASTLSRKPRKAYEAMLKAVRDGEVDTILSYSNSRLTRRPRELEDLIDLHRSTGVHIKTLVSGDSNLATADGRQHARLLATIDAGEAEKTGERVRRAKEQRAAEGKPQLGRYRTFGYEPPRNSEGKPLDLPWVVIPDEAKIIKEAFTRRAAGESTTAIAKDLAGRGLTSVTGKPWTSSNLARILEKPGYAGLAAHNGVVVGKTNYPAIISEALFNAAQVKIKGSSMGKNSRKHLLSGILICSKCNHSMNGQNSRARYRCNPTHGGCGNTVIRMAASDAAITWEAIERWNAASQDSDNTAEVEDAVSLVDGKIAELEAAFANEDMPIDVFTRMLKVQTAKRSDLLKQVKVRVGGIKGHTALDFENLTLSGKRSVIERYIMHVKIKPSQFKGRGRVWEPGRYEIHWQDGTVSGLTADGPKLEDLLAVWGKDATEYVPRSLA